MDHDQSTADARCAGCGGPLPPRTYQGGSVKRTCSPTCRIRAWRGARTQSVTPARGESVTSRALDDPQARRQADDLTRYCALWHDLRMCLAPALTAAEVEGECARLSRLFRQGLDPRVREILIPESIANDRWKRARLGRECWPEPESVTSRQEQSVTPEGDSR